MSWNYRIVFDEDIKVYAIHEVYYGEGGKIEGMTANSIAASGDSLHEVSENLEWMMKAVLLPAIKMSDLSEMV